MLYVILVVALLEARVEVRKRTRLSLEVGLHLRACMNAIKLNKIKVRASRRPINFWKKIVPPSCSIAIQRFKS
jgi:hypothetical protein